MKITIKPQILTGHESWEAKQEGVVFVQKREDIEPVWEALCEQDDYWESYKNLIKVGPTEINHVYDLKKYCEYCGKTDIYDVAKLKQKLSENGIEIFLFQYRDEY